MKVKKYISLDKLRRLNVKKFSRKGCGAILVKLRKDFFVLFTGNEKNQILMDFYTSKRGKA